LSFLVNSFPSISFT